MRKETVMDITKRLMREKESSWQEQLKKEVIGTTVLTAYTNKTYLVDDIDFGMTPKSKFKPAYKEDEISYMDYYESRYNIKVKDQFQFMLVSKAKERDLRAGKNELIYLIPELCRATGMTEGMRANFKLMQNLSTYTRLNPDNRVKALQKFNNRIQSTDESTKVLNEWKMELDQQLLTIPARVYPPEMILFGNDEQLPANPKGEWDFRKNRSMYRASPIVRWVCVFPEALRADTDNFLQVLKRACDEMSCQIKDPLM